VNLEFQVEKETMAVMATLEPLVKQEKLVMLDLQEKEEHKACLDKRASEVHLACQELLDQLALKVNRAHLVWVVLLAMLEHLEHLARMGNVEIVEREDPLGKLAPQAPQVLREPLVFEGHLVLQERMGHLELEDQQALMVEMVALVNKDLKDLLDHQVL
jgi:hypothetical protein